MKLTDERVASIRRDIAMGALFASTALTERELSAVLDEVLEHRALLTDSGGEQGSVSDAIEALRAEVGVARAQGRRAIVDPDDLEQALDAYEGKPVGATVSAEAYQRLGDRLDRTAFTLREVTAERDAAQALIYRMRALLALDGLLAPEGTGS